MPAAPAHSLQLASPGGMASFLHRGGCSQADGTLLTCWRCDCMLSRAECLCPSQGLPLRGCRRESDHIWLPEHPSFLLASPSTWSPFSSAFSSPTSILVPFFTSRGMAAVSGRAQFPPDRRDPELGGHWPARCLPLCPCSPGNADSRAAPDSL